MKRLCPGDILCSELQSHSERGRFLRDLLERGEQLPEVHNLVIVHFRKLQQSASPSLDLMLVEQTQEDTLFQNTSQCF